ncbi:MAG: ParB/RepB/Spo0J family partition protein [Bryobacterales bacterium]|nr:ParB/RepB/Spo0J family partition protein [Bryobacterales bacterium]
MSNAPANPRKALGKGLSSLLPGRPVTPPVAAAAAPAPQVELPINKLPIQAIEPNPTQPRSVFDAARLAELAQSIRSNGIIQPLIVRKLGDQFHLIAGERRWRAAKLAGLTEVPVVVQELSDAKVMEVALIENIQREDLNPIEVAIAFEKLVVELGLSHEEIGQRTGKDRSTITNMLRLLRLPGDIQIMIAERRLSMGHARAILGLPDEDMQREIAEKAAAQGMSVRQVEQIVQKLTKPRDPKKDAEPDIDPNVKAAIRELEDALGTKVRIIERAPGKGRIEIDYYSNDDLDRVYSVIVGEAP